MATTNAQIKSVAGAYTAVRERLDEEMVRLNAVRDAERAEAELNDFVMWAKFAGKLAAALAISLGGATIIHFFGAYGVIGLLISVAVGGVTAAVIQYRRLKQRAIAARVAYRLLEESRK